MKSFVFFLTSLAVLGANAVSLKDYSPYKYEVLFTNPDCETYKYDRPILARDGSELIQKPKNVYCKPSDAIASGKRENSPQFRLIEWISDSATKELFLAYLSFSNKGIADALCEALKKGVKVDFVLDQNPDEGETNSLAENLKQCGDIKIHYRGNRGGIGFAHNKLLMVNPNDKKNIKLVFSSANMSTGTTIHHENWNFVTTSPRSYFAQAHLCLKDGMILKGESKKEFVKFISECRAKIATEEEDDIKTFFVPGEGKKALNVITELSDKAKRVDMVAHRFSGAFHKLTSERLSQNKKIRLVCDDDMYWTVVLNADTGRNTRQEAYRLAELIKQGLDVKYMETNHQSFLLQHNKFMIFDLGAKDAVFTGAGNFTTSAFESNFENFYLITIPEVVKSFQDQFENFWSSMATAYEKMPRRNILP